MRDKFVKTSDPLVIALQNLLEREGGYSVVADKADVNDQSLYQIATGKADSKTGQIKGVGPTIRKKLTVAYPDWLGLAQQQDEILFSLADDAPRDDLAALLAQRGAPTREQVLRLIADLTLLPEASSLMDHIHQKAEYARDVIKRTAQGVSAPEAADRSAPAPSKPARPTTTATTMAAANARPRTTLKVKIGDGNPRQGLLPLTTVEDPFTAEPAPRELDLYRRIETSRKP